MRYPILPAAILATALACDAFAGSLPPETPIIVDGPIAIDAGDFEGYMLRVPAPRRAEVRGSHERVASMADNLFIARSLAARARLAGLDKDVAVQRRLVQVQDALLADLYIQQYEKEAPVVNLEQRARELYNADPPRYTSAEQVHVQHLLVGLNGRTREMAAERARQIHADAKSGKEEFLALAARFSDDPGKKHSGGDLGYNSPTSFDAPVAQAIAKMTRKGEISEPIESHQGFHIVRFVDRKAPELAKFDAVKKSIIAVERERLAKKRTEDLVQQIRSSSTVTVYRDNLGALVTPLDDVLSKAAAAAAAADAKPAR